MAKNIFQLNDEEKRQFMEDFRKRFKVDRNNIRSFKNFKKNNEVEEIKEDLKKEILEK